MTDDLRFVPRSEIARALSEANDPIVRAGLLATASRLNALYMIARAGSGHIGSSFSSLDIMSWLYLNEMNVQKNKNVSDVFFSSKGHDAPALYAVLIGLGLLPEAMLDGLRKLGGLPGHPDVATPYIQTNTGSLGMGISKAKGMIEADRLAGRARRYFVMTGDGELQEGQLWESLQGAVNRNLSGLTVIVDHNKVQSDHYVSATSDLGDIEAKFAAFGWNVARCNGHDFAALRDTINSSRMAAKPTVIVADTVKGKGVPFMESTQFGPHDFYRFHSGAPSAEDYKGAVDALQATLGTLSGQSGAAPMAVESRPRTPASPTSPQLHRLIPAYADALLNAGKQNPNIVALDGDLVLDCGVVPFRDAFWDRYIECGIAEQDMVSMAGGLSLGGRLPIVHSFACFLTPRANEQIYNNATEGTKIIYVGSLAGLLPGGPGHSHQSVRDISLMANVSGMTLFEPATGREASMALNWMIEQASGPCYLRLVSIPVALTYDAELAAEPVVGRGMPFTEGEDAVIFAYGPVMLSEAVAAAQELRQAGLGIKVVNLPWLNRVDADWLRACVAGIDHVFTIDNHYREGGQGERIAATIAQLGLERCPRVRCLGLDEIPACGTNEEVLRHHRLDRDSIAAFIYASLDPATDSKTLQCSILAKAGRG